MLKSINSTAQYLRTSFSNVDPLWVLDIDAFSLKELPPLLVEPSQSTPSHHCNDDSCATCHTEQHLIQSSHSANVLSTHGFSFPGEVNLHELKILLDKLLYSYTDTGYSHEQSHSIQRAYGRIFRMKGVFHVQNEEYLYLMQAVHDVFDIQPSTFSRHSVDDKTNGMNSVILIGKNLDQNYLEKEIKGCLITVDANTSRS